ncbi:MAG: HAMP domain-containing sensor histidine kinase [Candidatus Limnocylindrales bacterium]|jgi:two-component system sensor histidine kinase BaeS
MSLRVRIAIGFALVALVTAAIVALATPPIVGQGFAELDNEGGGGAVATAGATAAPSDDDSEAGQPAPAPLPGQAQQSTILRLMVAAAAAAVGASLLGLLGAGRLVRPLTRLEQAASGVARGDLTRRSGLADRSDEFGQLGRTFDSMAGELERAEETRRGFLQDAAHELRTPLAVIDATSSAILDGVYTPDRRHIETIRDQSRVLARIVDDLRTISLAEGGHLPLERRTVDVAATLSSVAAGFEARAAAGSVTIAVDAPGGLAVDADPDRVRQIVTALVDNALRHTPDGGTVRLVAAPAAVAKGRGVGRRAVRISVEDTGPGIPPEALPRVFERFFQADPSHSRGAGTSGLGLSIVQALAQAQGGRAGAENGPSGGARLWFELPSASGGAGATA